jgi:hypothetical protein
VYSPETCGTFLVPELYKNVRSKQCILAALPLQLKEVPVLVPELYKNVGLKGANFGCFDPTT